MPVIKVSQRPLTVQDSCRQIKTSESRIDSSIQATDAECQKLISDPCLGVQTKVGNLVKPEGGLDAHWSGCDWNQYKDQKGER